MYAYLYIYYDILKTFLLTVVLVSKNLFKKKKLNDTDSF